VVPSSYLTFMITSAGAAGAMIGLLFVAISLRSSIVFGTNASAKACALAASGFTGLVNAFSLSLLAIIPKTNVGAPMVVLAMLCFYNTLRLHQTMTRVDLQYRVLIVSALTYVAQFLGGVTLLVRPHSTWIINGLCYVICLSFAISLTRAWSLLQGEIETESSDEL